MRDFVERQIERVLVGGFQLGLGYWIGAAVIYMLADPTGVSLLVLCGAIAWIVGRIEEAR